jgi:hypothetical protein
MTTTFRMLTSVAALLAGGFTLPTCWNAYHADIERICDAEHRSGLSVKTDATGVQNWLQHSVASADGVVLLNQLQAEAPRDRAVQLRTEARSQSIAACPLADSFDLLAKDDDYKTGIASLCSGESVTGQGSIARLDVAYADDAERMRELADWAQLNLKSSEAQNVVTRMAQAAVKDRGAILRGEATKVGIPACALAVTLDQPAPPSALQVVSLPAFSVTTVDAPGKLQRVLSDSLTSGPIVPVINACYGPALAKTPTLAGSVVLRMMVDSKGRVTKAEDGGSALGNQTVLRCILNAVSGAVLIPMSDRAGAAPPSFKCSATLALSPTRGIPPSGWPSFAPAAPPTAAPDGGAPDGGGPDAGKKKKGR